MRGKYGLVFVVGAIVFLFVIYIFFTSDVFGGIMDPSGVSSALTGIRDQIVGDALGGTVSPAV